MEKELLIEIGTEEMPARFSQTVLSQVDTLMKERLSHYRIQYGQMHVICTPRRLALCVRDVEGSQGNQAIRAIGPPVRIAFDKDGNPAKAAMGFARNQGVGVEDLKVEEIPERGKYIVVEKMEMGRETKDMLPLIIPEWIRAINFPKTMRWGNGDMRFARPIHWILAIYGGEVVKFSLDGIVSGNLTRGHRFKHQGEIEITDFDTYISRLENAYVICDPGKRRSLILEQAEIEAKRIGGRVRDDTSLLEEVTHLVEWPVALCGAFDSRYLQLPFDVLVTTMRDHQRYFCVIGEKDELLPRFITISNTPADDPGIIIKGNERVLEARLSDAEFFYKEDTKILFDRYIERLKHVVFQERLGSLYEKAVRLNGLSLTLIEGLKAPMFNPEEKAHLKKVMEEASLLCKCDLVTQMVGEFPELQGIMGREYAKKSDINPDVAQAIFEHYLPRFAGDELPGSIPGAILGIANRMDNLIGCFYLDIIPTGSEDPHALRRQTLGIIQIVLEKGLIFSFDEFVQKGLSLFPHNLTGNMEEVGCKINTFLNQRLNNYFLSIGYDYDLINAVLDTGEMHPIFIQKRLDALKAFRSDDAFETILTPFKRVINILPKAEVVKEGFEFYDKTAALKKGKDYLDRDDVDTSLLVEKEERELYERFKGMEADLEDAINKNEYLKTLRAMVGLKGPIDSFFDTVLVMHEDEKLQRNRLALLSSIGKVFLKIADFSKIVQE